MIENERIRIYPANRDQMEKIIALEKDEELQEDSTLRRYHVWSLGITI